MTASERLADIVAGIDPTENPAIWEVAWLAEWLAWDALYRSVVGTVLGIGVGWLLGASLRPCWTGLSDFERAALIARSGVIDEIGRNAVHDRRGDLGW